MQIKHLIINVYRFYKQKKIRNSIKRIGKTSYVSEVGLSLSAPDNICIGDNVLIHENARLDGQGGIIIDDNVVCARNLTILTANHNYENSSMLPWDEEIIFRPVRIEENVWICANVIVLPGVRVGEGAVIGAGSVVTKDVDKCAVVAGNPARVIKYRDIRKYDELKSSNKFRTMVKDNKLLKFFASIEKKNRK